MRINKQLFIVAKEKAESESSFNLTTLQTKGGEIYGM